MFALASEVLRGFSGFLQVFQRFSTASPALAGEVLLGFCLTNAAARPFGHLQARYRGCTGERHRLRPVSGQCMLVPAVWLLPARAVLCEPFVSWFGMQKAGIGLVGLG